MSCYISNVAILNIVVIHIYIVCCISEVSPNPAALVLNGSTRNSIGLRNKRDTSFCTCVDEGALANCHPTVCKCKPYRSVCPAETDFCEYKRCFGKPCERLWGSSLCQCLNGKWCIEWIKATDLQDPRVLVDTEPEVGELQHTYVFPYRLDRASGSEPTLFMYYDSYDGLQFHVKLELFHLRSFEYAIATESDILYPPRGADNHTRSSFYAIWIHYPYSNEDNYKLRLKMEGLFNWERTYVIKPKKLPGKCYPVIKIEYCSSASLKPVAWFRGTTYTLKTKQENQCKQSTLTSTLSIFKLGTTRETPPWPVLFRLETLDKWKWDYSDNQYKTMVQSSNDFELNATDLQYGLNVAVLQVVETPMSGTGMVAGKNVVMCFLSVKPTATVARIRGGGEVNYSNGTKVVMDGRESYNPNAAPDKQKGTLGFAWSCWDKNNPNDVSVCKGPHVEISKDAVFTPNLKLVLFTPYEFQLTTIDRSLSSGSHVTQSKAVQTVTVTYTKPVKAVIKGGAEAKFGRRVEIVLDSEGTFNPNAPSNKQRDTLGFSWSCWDKDNPKNTSVCQGPGVELSKEAVFTVNFKLVEFRPYVFQLTAFDKMLSRWTNGTHGKAVQTVTIEFEVEPVTVVIKGGSDLRFQRGEKVVLDSAGTYNPNADPEKQKETLGYSWSCWDRDVPSDTTVCKGPSVELSKDAVFFANLSLVESRPYVFQLKAFDTTLNIVGHPTEGKATATVQVWPPAAILTRLDITFCVDLCGCSAHKAQAEEIIQLQASCQDYCPTVPTYTWDVRPLVSLTRNTVFEPFDKLAIKANVLTEGKTYIISVTGGDGAVATHTLTMNEKPSPGQCDVTPQSGNVEDLFTVKCTGFKDEDIDRPLTFRVYQEDTSDAKWQCLMAVNAAVDPWTVKLSGLLLMEGHPAKLIVKAVDYYGSVARVPVSLEIRPPNGGWSFETIQRMFDMNKEGMKTDNQKVQTVFMLNDALSKLPVEDEDDDVVLAKFQMKKTFLQWLDNVQLNDSTAVMQITNAVGTLLKRNDNVPMHHENARLASALTLKLAKQVLEVANNGRQFGCLSKEDIQEASNSLVQTSTSILEGVNTVDKDKDKSSEKDEDNLYPDYTGFDTDAIERENNKNLASKDALEALEILGSIISKNRPDSAGDTSIVADTIRIWTATERPCVLAEKYLPESTNINRSCQDTTVYISKPLCYHLTTIAPIIKLKVTIFKNNPQSFKADSDKLNAEFVSIGMTPFEMNKDSDIKSIEKLAHPIDIFLMLKQNTSGAVGGIKSLDQGSVKVNTMVDWRDLEDNITVHRVILEKGTKMIVVFEQSDLPIGIAAVITQEVRPNMEDFDGATIITRDAAADRNKYDMEYRGYAQEDGAWFYLGVLPDKNETSKHRQQTGGGNLELKYSFKIFQVKCCYMNENSSVWMTDGCVIGPDTQFSCLHCRCTHLSTFTGSINLIPSMLDPFIGVELFFKLTNSNIFVVCVVVSVLFMYLLGLIWGRRKDRNDLKSRTVTVLADNNRDHKYCYLLVVYTGHRIKAGTSSSIGFELIGQDGHSGPHIFSDSKRRILQRGSECAFLLLVGTGLGDLEHLHLWSNNSGRNPKWYCDKIVVTDLENYQSWDFIYETWLSVSKGGSVYTYSIPATDELTYSKKFVCKACLFNGLRDMHIWASIWLRHPLSDYTRCQRLSVAVCALMVMMLFAILLHGIPNKDLSVLLDEDTTLSWSVIIIAVYCALLVEIPSTILSMLFRRSPPPDTFTLHTEAKKPAPKRRSKVNVPVHHETDNIVKFHSRLISRWLIHVSWVLCLAAILVSSSLVIHYGLSYSKAKSHAWFLSVVCAVFILLVIVEPAKMLILVVFCVVRRKKEKQPNMYVKYVNKRTLTTEKTVYAKELYRPLPTNAIKHKMHDEETRNKMGNMLVDFIVFLFYVTTLFFMVLSNRDDLAFQSSINIIDMLAEVSKYKSLSNVQTIQDAIDYLNYTVLPGIYVAKHYNGDNVSEIALTADYSTRLLGIPRLRQLRVRNQSCVLPSIVRETNLTEECFGAFNTKNADSSDYNLKWTQNLEDYELMQDKAKAFWKYSNDTVTQSMPVLGEFRVYPVGGYVANLGRTLSNSRNILHFLVENDWFDQRSRVLFIEFTTYNANRNLFNVVSLVVERSASTAILTSKNIATVRLLILKEDVKVVLNVVFFIALSLIVVHYVRNLFHKGKFLQNFISFWNLVDFCIIALCIASVSMFLLRDAYVRELLDQLEKSYWNEYVSFSLAAYYDIYFSYVLALLVCLSTCRLWKLLHFSLVFRQMEWTLANSMGSLFSLFFLMSVLITMFATSGFLMFGQFSKEFRHPYDSVVTLVLFANRMFPKIYLDRIVVAFSYIAIFYFLMFWLGYTFYFFNLFFAVLTGRIAMLRLERATRGQYRYGLSDYLSEEFKFYFNKLKKSFNCKNSRHKRLRGGEESGLNLIAVLKLPNIRNCTYWKLRDARLEAMALLVLGVVEGDTADRLTGDKAVEPEDRASEKAVGPSAAVTTDTVVDARAKAMLALVLDEMNSLGTEGEVYFQEPGNKSRLITDKRLRLMEATLNRFTRRNVTFNDFFKDNSEGSMTS